MPEQSKTLAMLAEERLGFEEAERFFSVFDATSEEDEPETISLRKGRLFDLVVQKESDQTDVKLGEQMKEGGHVGGFEKSCQKPSADDA